MFVHGFGDKVQAIDAATGDLLWQYSRRLPRDRAPTVKRGIALYGDKLYVPTSDTHMVALNVKTGDVVWDHAVADPEGRLRHDRGTARRQRQGDDRHHRPRARRQLHRRHGRADRQRGVALQHHRHGPASRAATAGTGCRSNKRNGASVWVPASYDQTLNLAFFGPAQTYDTGPLRNPVGREGITNDGLYTDSTLAINVDTGKLVWFFQHQPNDQWDYDWAFERQVLPLPVNGTDQAGGGHRRQAGDLRRDGSGHRQVRVLVRPRRAERGHGRRPEDGRQDHRRDAGAWRRRRPSSPVRTPAAPSRGCRRRTTRAPRCCTSRSSRRAWI